MSIITLNSSNNTNDFQDVENHYLKFEYPTILDDVDNKQITQQIMYDFLSSTLSPQSMSYYVRIPNISFSKNSSSEYWILLKKDEKISNLIKKLNNNLS